MKNIFLSLGFAGMLLLSGCGGGSSSSDGGGASVTPKESSILSSDASRKINIPQGERIIFGGGALTARIYDAGGTEVGTANNNQPVSVVLSAGDYTVSGSQSTNIYSDAEGVIFYVSSNIGVNNLPLNSKVSIPKRTAKIYQLNVEQEGMYLISTSRLDMHIYNSFLVEIAEVDQEEAVSLAPGLYYFVADTDTFIMEGSFSITPM